MERFKGVRITLMRHIVLPIVAIAVIFIMILLMQILGAKDQSTYKITHLYGDSTVLEGVTISGKIIDAYHKTSFTWHGDTVGTKTEVYPVPQHEWRYRYYPGFYHRINDDYYSAYIDIIREEFSINREPNKNNRMSVDMSSAVGRIPIERLFNKGNITESTNFFNFGLAEVGGEIYFTFPSTAQYKGDNGIYKLNFEDRRKVDPTDRPLSPAIMTFSLNSNAEENAEQIAVLGLEAVDDTLVLILLKDDALVIEGYNTDGVKIGEAVVTPFLFEELNAELSKANTKIRYDASYEAYSHTENGVLSLSFKNNQSQRTVVSVEVSKQGLLLADITDIEIEDEQLRENKEYVHGQRYLTYKDGKLYYAGVFRKIEDDKGYALDILSPMTLLLNVYEQGEKVYSGELITDVNDDLIRLTNVNLYNLSYDELVYRNFFDLYIK